MGRGKRNNGPSKAERRATRNFRIMVLSLVVMSSVLVYFVVLPYFPNAQYVIDQLTGEKVPIGQGVKVTGTAIYANDTAITSQTLRGEGSDGKVLYIASISDGSFTTNRGPAAGGTFRFYMAITDCVLFVGAFDIPAAADYDQESFNVGEVKVYTLANDFVAMVIGSATNSVTVSAGTGTAGTNNYTASDGADTTFTLRLENTEDYSRLFRQYTDPRDETALRPVLWIEIASTTIYSNGFSGPDGVGAYKTWANSTARIWAFELGDVTCEGTASMIANWNIVLNSPNTGTFKVDIFLVDGSYLDHVALAQSRVADPNTSETVTTYQLVDAYLTVS